MSDLFIELIEIMEQECKNNKTWQKKKPVIIEIRLGDDD